MRACVLCVVALVMQSSAVQNPVVKRAKISLTSKSIAVEHVTIENLRDTPIVSWHIGLFRPGAERPSSVNITDWVGAEGNRAPGTGPVAPHERRVVDIEAPESAPDATPQLMAIAFADGYYEGTAAGLDDMRTRRRKQVDELSYWIGAIDGMPRDSESRAREYLADRAADSSAHIRDDAGGTQGQLFSLSRNGSSVLSAVDGVRAGAQQRLNQLQPWASISVDGRKIESVPLTNERAASSRYTVVIENLADTPIEALAYDISTRTGGQGSSMDFCGVPPGVGRRFGPIAPGETREEPYFREVKEGEDPPAVRLRYVMFENLSFEGSAADRDEVLTNRERSAADAATEIDVLTQAAAAPAKMIDIFTAARADWTRSAQFQGRPAMRTMFDEYVRRIRTNGADAFLATIPTLKAGLEAKRQRLLRHQAALAR
jgi:hypothetical protein